MNNIQRLFFTFVSLIIATASWAYNITIDGMTNGNVTPSATEATAATVITLTVTPASGYYLETLTVIPYADAGIAGSRRTSPTNPTINSTIPLSPGSAPNTYTFTMPSYDVVVRATFTACTDISGATINLAESSHVFDWLSHTPVINSVVVNSTTLTEGTDYTVSGISAYMDAGTYHITVTGIGKYTGSKQIDYTINLRNLAGATGTGGYPAATVHLSGTSYVYNNAIQKPTLSGVYMNGQTLILDTDYQNVTYSNGGSKDKGNYTVTITGKGNFTGTVSATYTITQAPISEATFAGTSNFVYSGNVQSPTGFTLTYCGESLDATNHYDLSYASGNSTEFSATCSSTNIGTYKMKITAKGSSNYTGSKEIIYTISSAGPTIYSVGGSTTTYSTTYTGSEIKPAVVVKDGSTQLTENTHFKVIYSDNKNVGTAKISVVGIDVYNFVAETTFNITPKSVSGLTIELSQNSFTYNTSNQKPIVTVKDGETTLTENKDYTLVNAGGVNVGTYHATITGIGNYTGDVNSEGYSITALTYSNTNTTITMGTTDYVYDGTAKTPTVQQVKIGDIVIPSTDYTPAYSSNTDAGTATVTISPKTTAPINLSGSASTTFTIAKKPVSDLTITLSATTFTYNGNEQKPTVTVKDGGTTLTQGTHYTLSWPAASTAVGSYSITITGTGNYTGSVSKTYVINYGTSDSDFTVTVSGTYTYNGSAYTPAGSTTEVTTQAVVVKNGTTILTPTTDYTLSYSNNINAGTATVTATGKGNYQFVQTGTFTIDPKPLTAAMIAFTHNTFVYNGSVQKPTVTVTDNTKTLVEGTDYTLTNNGATNVSAGNTVTIVGMGNYSGTLNSTTEGMPTYSITALDISSTSGNTVTITLYPLADATYNGSAKTPEVQQVKVNNIVFTSGYTVSYANNTNVAQGTTQPTVTVTGSGNLTGTASTTFVINPKPLTDGMVTFSTSSFTYTGGAQKPTVTVTDVALPGDNKTVASTNYTVNWPANVTDPGEKEVQIVGQNNYSGTITKKYVINKIGNDDITVTIGGTYTYDGSPQTPHDVSGTNNITVKKGATTTLTFDTDYSVAYQSNTKAGTATAIITGKGNYSFTVEQTFTIAKRNLSNATITLTGIPTTGYYTYDGTLKKPGVSVTDIVSSSSIISSKDYTITNEGNINSSSTDYTVTISSNDDGNYTGEVTRTYQIHPYALPATTSVTLDQSTFVYDGSAKTPNVLVVKVGELIVPTYSTVYANNTSAAMSTATVAPTVTVTASGNFSGSINKTFTISPRPVTSDMIVIPEAEMNLVYTGGTLKPNPTIQDLKDPNDVNSNIIEAEDYTLYNDGGIAVGNYKAKIVGKRNYTGTAEKQYSIVAKESSSAFTIADVANQPFTGSAITPSITVYKAGTTTELSASTDYDVTFTDNINVGTATVTVTGKGNYSGTKTTTFGITAKSLTDGMVALSNTSFPYNGKDQSPTVTVTDAERGKQLTAGTDYNVILPTNMRDQGTKTITVNGIGNYQGTIEKTYSIGLLSINGAGISLNELPSYVYDGTAKKPTIREVTIGTMVVPTTGYTVGYDEDVTNQGVKTITITGIGNFIGSATTTYTITPKPVTRDMIILSSGNLAYSGTLLKPEVTVKDGEKLLIEGETKDYTLVNDGATNVGEYSVFITGHGNYGGSASKSYNIIAAGATGFIVADISNVEYTGVAQEPIVVVTDAESGAALTKDTHYTVNYLNNINVGTAQVNVTGKGNYSGTATQTFKITPKTLTAAMVTVSGYTTIDGYVYNGEIQKPTVIVADGTAMKESDYVVLNNGGVNVNEVSAPYEVKITGTNNYTGEIIKTFHINPLDIEDAAITLYQLSNKAYDGTAKTPGVREVVTAANIVVPTVGYDVTYSNNINAGTANVTITGKNNFKGTASTTFAIEKKTVTSSMITLDEENFNYNGSTQKPNVTISDKNGDVECISADDYTLYNDGGIEVGDYKVKITGKRNYQGDAEKQYSILEKDAVLNKFKITLSETSMEYNGEAQKPSVTVKDGEKKLDETTDYDVVYSNNTNAGTATVTVTGKGNYAGTRSTTFEITKKPLTATMISISGYTTTTGFTYSGANQAPMVEVRDGTALTASDYVVTNNGGTNHGTYHVIVTGTGNYSGEFDYTFYIAKRNIEGAKVTLYELTSYIYDGKAKKPGVKEVAFAEEVIPTAGYSVAYSNNTNAGTATVTITGQGNYAGELTTNFNIEKKTLTSDMIVLSNDEYVYNGGNQKPMVVLMDGETEMVLDTDYTLTNLGGTSVGTYDVIANGKGNYNGMAVKQFSIITKGIGAFEVSLSTEQVVYNGSEHRPTVTVKDGEKTLTAGSEYTVNYTDNVNVGTATVTVTGQGEYSGTTTKTFIIKPKTLTEDMVFLSSSSYTYNTLQQKPTVTVSDQSFLTYNDYTLTNDGGVDHGEYDVVVIGRNNYVGTVIKHFSILPQSIENAKVTLYEMASYVYDGKAKNPGVREVTIGNTIVPTSSYTTEISANINVGTVTVTVTGLENFKGTATATFDITPKPLSEQMVILSEELIYYTGETLKPTVELKDGETMLTEGTDYQLTNEGGIAPGIYDVVAMGIGNYTGTITKTFKIERSDISIDITAEDSEHGEFGVKLIVSQISEENQNVRVTGITIPEADKSKVMTLKIPATVEAEGVIYPITEIAAGAFADVEQLSDLYLPETEDALTVGNNAIPATTTVHTSLALLDDYALMPSLDVNFRVGKVMTTVIPKNQFWTFSSGVDVYVPEGVTVFTVQERSNTAVAIVELTNSVLTSSGTRMIKSNNGVLLQGSNQASYDVVACPRRMSSGTVISTSDHKDYGEENCLVPVIEATHYETDYYILKNNKFCSIRLESADVKVPAGKAVLYLPSVAEGRQYGDVLDMIDGTTGIRITESGQESNDVWYDLGGRRVEKPTKKGIYIHNGKKVMIR